MRADRLVAALLMLQARGRVTAAQLAEELEVSERTARRDLEALGMAGFPVYSVAGRNGGWELLGGGRTDLSGLTAAEAQALFLVAGPASGTPEVRRALRKLVRALPESFRSQAEAASGAVLHDPVAWGQRDARRPVPEHLDALQQAVIDGVQVSLGYVDRARVATTRVVHPLGLAAKGTAWYLVAGTADGLRTFRVDRVTTVDPTGAPTVRPADFDLAEAWAMITREVDERRAGSLRARLRVSPHVMHWCRGMFGDRVSIGPAGDDGWVEAELRGHDPRSLAAELAGFGASIVVVDPPELRAELATIGAELTASYPVTVP
jgi:predicted DNA-binding transcriptional regulator YafY